MTFSLKGRSQWPEVKMTNYSSRKLPTARICKGQFVSNCQALRPATGNIIVTVAIRFEILPCMHQTLTMPCLWLFGWILQVAAKIWPWSSAQAEIKAEGLDNGLHVIMFVAILALSGGFCRKWREHPVFTVLGQIRNNLSNLISVTVIWNVGQGQKRYL
jgi:hypothetical protein